VALPGRGLLGIRASNFGYLKPTGLDKIVGYNASRQDFDGVVPHMIPVVNFHALVETNFAPGTGTATLDLFADPGQSVKLSIVDQDGKSLAGTTVNGADGILGRTRATDQTSSEIMVKSLTPDEPRRVMVRHTGRKLVGAVVLKGDEASPLTLKLQPWAEIKGRIIDDDGQPCPKLALGQPDSRREKRPFEEIDILPGTDIGGGIALDKDGRFHVVGLVPGLYYAAGAIDRGVVHIGELFDDTKMEPGEMKDLGDLKVLPYKEGNDE